MIFCFLPLFIDLLEVPTECHNYSHENQVDETQRHEVFPLELKYLVDTQTGECPAHPHKQPYHGECLAEEPYDAGDEVEDVVNGLYADVERSPTTEEHCGGDT